MKSKANKIKVPCIDFSKWVLENFSQEDKVILKLDIEGAEYDFLLGKDLSRIGALGLEIHGPYGEEKKQELKDYLLKYFDIYHIESDEKPSPENNWAPTVSEITYINKDLK